MLAPADNLSGFHAISLLEAASSRNSLDPGDWPSFRVQAHRMLDDMLDYTEHISDRPVWQPPPENDGIRQSLPQTPTDLRRVHERFMHEILPFSAGNVHPGFMGWVHGGSTPVGMLAEMLAAGLNANLAGRNQVPIEVERQVLRWVRQIFSFPESASGLFVTGTSVANLIALLVARTSALGPAVREQGIGNSRLIAYTSSSAHASIAQALDLAGIGSAQLRVIAVNQLHQIEIGELETQILADRKAGLTPFFIAAGAGTVDVGAIDDLEAVAKIARRHKLWFHVDGAFGALAMLAPDLAPLLNGIQSADSIAFDFHKWGQVPYDAGFVLIRDGTLHYQTFAQQARYLAREERGLAAGSAWPCDFGPDQSRGFRALKTWFTLQVYGSQKLGEVISHTCSLARYLRDRIAAEPRLELLAPVALNVVCFRFRCNNADQVNRDIVADLQEAGLVAPSTTTIHGHLSIRAAIVNHRTTVAEIDALVRETLAFGARYV